MTLPAFSWLADAACRSVGGVEFFPDHGEHTHPARAVCKGCSVKVECLVFALEQRPVIEEGVWGGQDARERRRLRARVRDGEATYDVALDATAHIRVSSGCGACKTASERLGVQR